LLCHRLLILSTFLKLNTPQNLCLSRIIH